VLTATLVQEIIGRRLLVCDDLDHVADLALRDHLIQLVRVAPCVVRPTRV
jgi:hypothetical protein